VQSRAALISSREPSAGIAPTSMYPLGYRGQQGLTEAPCVGLGRLLRVDRLLLLVGVVAVALSVLILHQLSLNHRPPPANSCRRCLEELIEGRHAHRSRCCSSRTQRQPGRCCQPCVGAYPIATALGRSIGAIASSAPPDDSRLDVAAADKA
jgi:hypothetical protein